MIEMIYNCQYVIVCGCWFNRLLKLKNLYKNKNLQNKYTGEKHSTWKFKKKLVKDIHLKCKLNSNYCYYYSLSYLSITLIITYCEELEQPHPPLHSDSRDINNLKRNK